MSPLRLFLLLSVFSFSCQPTQENNSALPQVTAVFPSSDTLPENLLRVYIQFSQPMKTVGNLEKIKLVDQEGKEVFGALFNNVYELWDDEQRQLTLLFDPGRVKTGLRAHDSLGRALRAGEHYQLKILELEDVNHQKLAQSFTKNLFISPSDTVPPDLSKWIIEPPNTGSRDQLTIRFPDILDQMSLQHRLVLTDQNKNRIPGEITLGKLEKSWQFTPQKKWLNGEYMLFVNGRLEDPAGNNLNGKFDHKKGSLKSLREGETFILKVTLN